MKEISEKDRKFIDMIDLKVSHSIFPVIYPPADSAWGNIFGFYDKVISPEKQHIQNFTGNPIIIVIVLLNGAAAYYDSTGYRKILHEKDTLLIGNDSSTLQTITFNFNETEDVEFLEIWIGGDVSEKRRQFFRAGISNEQRAKTPMPVPGLFRERISLTTDSWLWRGRFAEGSDHIISNASFNDNLILFVVSGSMGVNGRAMNYRDGLSLSAGEVITVHFEQETDLLAIQNQAI